MFGMCLHKNTILNKFWYLWSTLIESSWYLLGLFSLKVHSNCKIELSIV